MSGSDIGSPQSAYNGTRFIPLLLRWLQHDLVIDLNTN